MFLQPWVEVGVALRELVPSILIEPVVHETSIEQCSHTVLIPLNPGWFIGMPLLDDYNPQYIKGSF